MSFGPSQLVNISGVPFLTFGILVPATRELPEAAPLALIGHGLVFLFLNEP